MDFSRLGWLVETEAAFRVVWTRSHGDWPELVARLWYGYDKWRLAMMRYTARGMVFEKEVIV